MAFPNWLARFNRVVTNRLFRPLARRLPGYAVVVHTGRRSGREYRTPVNVFRRGGGYAIALTYGPDSDWVRNVLAAGGCRLETRGGTIVVGDPVVLRDPRRSAVPFLLRPFLRILGVELFLRLSPTTAPSEPIGDSGP
jgi:deazaflavin-dependent oxidoreductase (nitroreductase family)